MEYDVGEGLVLRPIEISWLAEHCTHHLASRADGQRAVRTAVPSHHQERNPPPHTTDGNGHGVFGHRGWALSAIEQCDNGRRHVHQVRTRSERYTSYSDPCALGLTLGRNGSIILGSGPIFAGCCGCVAFQVGQCHRRTAVPSTRAPTKQPTCTYRPDIGCRQR